MLIEVTLPTKYNSNICNNIAVKKLEPIRISGSNFFGSINIKYL